VVVVVVVARMIVRRVVMLLLPSPSTRVTFIETVPRIMIRRSTLKTYPKR